MSRTYRRKEGYGKVIKMSRKGGFKQRQASMKVYNPGDLITIEDGGKLPGIGDGWELLDSPQMVISAEEYKRDLTLQGDPNIRVVSKKDYNGIGPMLPVAVLKAERQRGTQWKVVIEEPGLNYTDSEDPSQEGVPLPKGVKVHEGFLTEPRARFWAENGYDPGEDYEPTVE